MKTLYLSYENQLNPLFLHGSGSLPPLRGFQRQPQPNRLAGGQVEEVIDLECRGAGVWSLTAELEKRLALAREGVAAQYLWFETSSRLSPVFARVSGGSLEALGGGSADRERGYQGLRLRLIRSDWLEENIEPVKLNNANGSNNISGIMLYNHADEGTGHVNFCDVNPLDIRGSQPLPVRLVLETGSSSVRRLGKIVVSGGIDLWDSESGFDHVLEGESAAAGADCLAATSVPDAAASGGAYMNFQWSALFEASLCRWTIDSGNLGWLAGRGLRPVARFHNPPPANTRWCWRILPEGGSSALDRSPQVLLDPASRLQVLPAIFPPVQASPAPYQPITLEAWLECGTPGVKQIDLDFIHLLPLENFCFFQPLSGLTQGQRLVIDWNLGEPFTEDDSSGEKIVTHTASGVPLRLLPGRAHRIYLLYESDLGFLISDTCQLRVQAGPRWIEP